MKFPPHPPNAHVLATRAVARYHAQQNLVDNVWESMWGKLWAACDWSLDLDGMHHFAQTFNIEMKGVSNGTTS